MSGSLIIREKLEKIEEKHDFKPNYTIEINKILITKYKIISNLIHHGHV